jgi:hypothetical protein
MKQKTVCDCKNYLKCVIAKTKKCVIAKNYWFISVTAKKKKELNHCVIATIWQPVVMCGCKKKRNLNKSVVEKLLGCLEYDCKPG